jgi:hypothetical protein
MPPQRRINREKDTIQQGDSIKIQIRNAIARRLTEVPRSGINASFPSQEYSVFHRITATAKRTALNGKDRESLIGLALKKKLKSDRFLASAQEPTRPRSEVRVLDILQNFHALSFWLRFDHCDIPSIQGCGNARVLTGGDIAIVTRIEFRYYYNKKRRSQRITARFDWCVYSPDRTTRFAPNCCHSADYHSRVRKKIFSIPSDVRVRSWRKFSVDDRFFDSRFADFDKYPIKINFIPNATPPATTATESIATAVGGDGGFSSVPEISDDDREIAALEREAALLTSSAAPDV